MNEHANKTHIALAENEYVKELFGILHDNGRDTSGLAAILGHVQGMEDFVKQAEDRIADMKSQLDTMKEIQNHPVKTALRNAIKALENTLAQVKTQLSDLKADVIESCKNAVTAFKENGITALDKLASFFHIKEGLQAMKNNIVASVNRCDKAVVKIEAFASEYHSAGLAIKNMARVAIGKPLIDAKKEAGKLAKAVAAPYKAHKSVLIGLRKSIDKTISALGRLEQHEKSRQTVRSGKNKPTLMEKLDANKEKVRQRELGKPIPERAPKAQALEV